MSRAEQVWEFIKKRGCATVADIRAEFGINHRAITSTVRHLHKQGCLTRKKVSFNHCDRFVFQTTNHNPPGRGIPSLAMRPIAVAPEKLPLIWPQSES